MLEKQHTLEWLDFIISAALNSSPTDTDSLTPVQYQTVVEKVTKKKTSIYSFGGKVR